MPKRPASIRRSASGSPRAKTVSKRWSPRSPGLPKPLAGRRSRAYSRKRAKCTSPHGACCSTRYGIAITCWGFPAMAASRMFSALRARGADKSLLRRGLRILLAMGGGGLNPGQHLVGEQVDGAHYLVMRRSIELHEQHYLIDAGIFQELQVADARAAELHHVLHRDLIDLLEVLDEVLDDLAIAGRRFAVDPGSEQLARLMRVHLHVGALQVQRLAIVERTQRHAQHGEMIVHELANRLGGLDLFPIRAHVFVGVGFADTEAQHAQTVFG